MSEEAEGAYDLDHISDMVHNYMCDANLTTKELAERADVAPFDVDRILDGDYNVPVGSLVDVLSVLGKVVYFELHELDTKL